MRLSRRGMTLIETLVAAVVLLAVLVMTLSFLYPSFAASSRSSLRIEMQQRTSLALEKMVSDLLQGSASSVATFPGAGPTDIAGFAVQPLQGYTGAGLQVWQTNLVAYYWQPGLQTLTRKVWPPGPPTVLSVSLMDTQPVRISAGDFATLTSTHNSEERMLVEGVTNFTLQTALGGGPPFNVTVRVTRTAVNNPTPETFELTRTIALRNS